VRITTYKLEEAVLATVGEQTAVEKGTHNVIGDAKKVRQYRYIPIDLNIDLYRKIDIDI